MELQKLSSKVSRGGFIDVSVEVGGNIFFHRGQVFGNSAEKLCSSENRYMKKNVQLKRRLIRGGGHIVCELTSVDAKEVRRDPLAKVANNDIEIGEATAV